MGIVKEKGVYIFEEFLDFGVIAGFTDKACSGLKPQEDINRILASLDLTRDNFFFLDQVHGREVIYPQGRSKVFSGDGLISDKKKEVLLIRTADCLPLFFYQPKKNIIGVIHLGWKPAKAGIIARFIDKLKDTFDTDLKDAVLGIGPGLRRCCFEVGDEFLGFDCFKDFIESKGSKHYLDMVSFLKKAFVDRGFKEQGFLDSQICSICDQNFHSARRDKGKERTLSFIIQK